MNAYDPIQAIITDTINRLYEVQDRLARANTSMPSALITGICAQRVQCELCHRLHSVNGCFPFCSLPCTWRYVQVLRTRALFPAE